ncbi:hypothetical protein AC578_3856 [Pseudocercospora eumusae]|uniref:Uncharacterized protein n=1 Tax=Pseudocercospora eumusae TaxID=321146 RepID=A0A139GX11_9PEZI|nr:hypothetical protein AC578_3856 [Pseudocercospora eumusae]
MSNPPPNPTHAQLTTLATSFIQAYNTCSTATPTNLSPINTVFNLRTQTCTQKILPSSIEIPEMKNPEYREFLERIVKMGWEGMKVSPSSSHVRTAEFLMVLLP